MVRNATSKPVTKKQTRSTSKSTPNPKTARKPTSKLPPAKKAKLTSAREFDDGEEIDEESPLSEDDDDQSDVYHESGSEASAAEDPEDTASLDSDALDDTEDFKPKSKKKRQISSTPKKSTPVKKARGSKVGGKRKRSPSEEDSDNDSDEGQKVVGRIVQAPTTGLVPPGRISQNTFDFLKDLKKPACNDREWFNLHKPVYQAAEKEWIAFIDSLVPKVTELDDQIPPLPPKDIVHRIYRDMRFSNDKTPYKTNFSASMSRSGRKGIFAGYHVSISPGGGSIVAAGAWCPAKNETATIRSHLLRNPSRLRSVIGSEEFVRLFGPAKPHPKGQRQNVFGHDDSLKVAPKGVPKDHKDIDLLKLRSIAISHRFLDSEVLDPGFVDNLCKVMRVMQPLVHCLNDMMTLPPDEDESEQEEEEDDS